MASVVLQNLSKVYPGEVHAVRDVTLEIAEGEFLVLVGPSGCGKSTTLRMIAGLESISSGTLKIGDQVVNHIPPRDRDIAMVFQNYALYPHMTVRKNLSFALKMRKTPKAEIEDRVAWAAELLGLEDLLGRKPKALSGGQRQRVALGRAIVRRPAVFLFDEPLSNLDAKLRVETRTEIRQLHRKLKTTTVYVTHDQEEAMTLGDRVVVMHGGLVRQCGAPLEVYSRPADCFVAGFLGMPAMNFLEGFLEQHDNRLWFVDDLVRLRLEEAPLEWLAGETRQPIVAGIRPESIELKPNPNGESASAIVATIKTAELLGSTMDVSLETKSGQRLICRTAVAPHAEGESVALTVAPKDIHLFEPSSDDDPVSPTRYGRNLRTNY